MKIEDKARPHRAGPQHSPYVPIQVGWKNFSLVVGAKLRLWSLKLLKLYETLGTLWSNLNAATGNHERDPLHQLKIYMTKAYKPLPSPT